MIGLMKKIGFVAVGVFYISSSLQAQVLQDQRSRLVLVEDEKKDKDKSLIHKMVTVQAKTPKVLPIEDWEGLLSRYVSEVKGVNYVGISKNFAKLEGFINAHNKLNISKLDENTKLAVYINLYNAGMIYNILRYARNKKISVHSQKFLALEINVLDISGSIWSNFDYSLPLAGERVTLDNVEHGLIRNDTSRRGKFAKSLEVGIVKTLDPRIHAAVNCAAISCPPVSDKAFRPGNVQAMLRKNIENYVNSDAQFSKASGSKMKANKIVFWYYDDFEKHAKTTGQFKGAGDYLAFFIKDATKDSKWKKQHLRSNFNGKGSFSLRFSSAFSFHYEWRINDRRNIK